MGFFEKIGNFFGTIGRGIGNFFGVIGKGIGNIYSKIIDGVKHSTSDDQPKNQEYRPSVFTKTVGQEENVSQNTNLQDNDGDGEFMYEENTGLDGQLIIEEKTKGETIDELLGEDNNQEFEYEEIKQNNTSLDVQIDGDIQNTFDVLKNKFDILNENNLHYEIEITENKIYVLKNGEKYMSIDGKYNLEYQNIQDIIYSLQRDNIELDKHGGLEEFVRRIQEFSTGNHGKII